jgi:hypothetical protein
VSSWLLALACTALSYGQNGANDTDPHATGYILPTPEQERHVQETHPRIVKVWPNRLAWTRVNEERKKKGLEPLPEKGIVPRGAEKAFTVGDGPVISAVPQGFVGLASLSTSVDNSTLPAFPEIRTQGSIGSCCPFAITYYQLTYTAACVYGAGAKDSTDDTWKFSPKWTYNMINEGADHGSNQIEAYEVLEQHGAAKWHLFPYQTNGADPKSYREWCLNAETWRDAIHYRIYPFFTYPPAAKPPNPDQFNEWLTHIKTLLMNGEVLTFPTYISNWQFTTLKDAPSTSATEPFVGQWVAYWVNGTTGGHVMTIVGYDDSVWTDINNNGSAEAEEWGALKIANSWGVEWTRGNAGFCWLAYDALRAQSAVTGGPSSGRQPAIMGYGVWSINIMLNYRPTLLAEFTVWHERRDQLGIALAASSGAAWTPGALQFQGGPYAFDGTSVPCEGTFVFDFTDVFQRAGGSDVYQLWVADDDDPRKADSFGRTDRRPAKLLNYRLIDMSPGGTTSGGPLDPPLQVDAGEDSVGLYHPSYTGPVAVASASRTSGRAPLAVTFYADGSSGVIDFYEWDFGDGAMGKGPSVDHTYTTIGTYVVTLTVRQDSTGPASSDQVVITATRKR